MRSRPVGTRLTAAVAEHVDALLDQPGLHLSDLVEHEQRVAVLAGDALQGVVRRSPRPTWSVGMGAPQTLAASVAAVFLPVLDAPTRWKPANGSSA